MARRAGARLDFGALTKRVDRYADLATKGVQQVRTRTLAVVKKRIRPEAARLLSTQVIALSARKIAPYLGVRVEGDAVVLTGSRARLPLSEFSPRQGAKGVIATLWRDAGPREFPHTFIRKGGKGTKKQVWQRAPFTGQKGQKRAPSGLVQRLPVVQRKGQSFSRAVTGKKHGDILPGLTALGRNILSEEVARVLESARA